MDLKEVQQQQILQKRWKKANPNLDSIMYYSAFYKYFTLCDCKFTWLKICKHKVFRRGISFQALGKIWNNVHECSNLPTPQFIG